MTVAKKDYRVYLDDIDNAIERIQEYTVDGKDRFFAQMMVQDAVIRQITIIGEAAARLPKHLRLKYPKLPWTKVIAMRNILIHEYSKSSIRRVWSTVTDDLPKLRVVVRQMIETEWPS